MALEVGTAAPQFSLPDQTGQVRNLTDYRGKWVVLYFYPEDDTPGCTTEACTLRDNFSAFAPLNTQVLGVSADSVDSHKKFAEKYHLPFTLLADTEKSLIVACDAKGLIGTKRISYLINPAGIIAKIYPKVTPADHAGEILADLQHLQIASQ